LPRHTDANETVDYGGASGLGAQARNSRLSDRQKKISGGKRAVASLTFERKLPESTLRVSVWLCENFVNSTIACPPDSFQALRMKNRLLLSLSLSATFLCFAHAQMSPSPEASNNTGVEGTITMSPVMGGPTRQDTPDSKPLANVAFDVKQGDRVITSFQTDDQGHFRQPLAPGQYTISRKDVKSSIGFYGPFEVSVSSGKMTAVQWHCDTGIR
jgi:hypothetical protein